MLNNKANEFKVVLYHLSMKNLSRRVSEAKGFQNRLISATILNDRAARTPLLKTSFLSL